MPICFVSANIWRYTGGLLLCPILPVWSALLSEVFLADTEESKQVFKYELEDGFTIFMKYWTLFAAKRLDAAYKEVESHTILDEIFAYTKIQELIDTIIGDYPLSAKYRKDKAPSLQIRDIRTLYHASPERSGVSITTIDRSVNSVIELHGDKIGSCRMYSSLSGCCFYEGI